MLCQRNLMRGDLFAITLAAALAVVSKALKYRMDLGIG